MDETIVSELIVDITISSDEYKKMYAGHAKFVFAQTRDGRRVRFPANILVPFVGVAGISGSFIISFDSSHRFQGIRRL